MLLDIRGDHQKDYYDNVRIFKSEWFDMKNFEQKLENIGKDEESEQFVKTQMKIYI